MTSISNPTQRHAMQLIKPTLICESSLFSLLPKPPLPFASHAFKVRQDEYEARTMELEGAKRPAQSRDRPQRLILFIGGFCDCIMRAVYREFESFVCDERSAKVYLSFPCRAFLASWLPLLEEFELFIIAHSWGARNAYWAIRDYEEGLKPDSDISESSLKSKAISYFLTLDPVGYHTPSTSLKSVELWENIYIEGKSSLGQIFAHRPNFAAFLGHAWNATTHAHLNHAIYPPAHHASISPMLAKSSLYTRIDV